MEARGARYGGVMDRSEQGMRPGDPPGAAATEADEVLAMAYVDGELDPSARASFEERLAAEPALGLAVAEQRALAVLARRTAPREPADHEWSRLQLEPWYRGMLSGGWLLVIIGTAISLALTIWGVATNDELDVVTRGAILGSLVGFILLFLTVLIRRLRTYELDPYRHVER